MKGKKMEMPKSCKYKTYQEGYIDGFNRCIEMIEKLRLSLISYDSLEKMKNIDFDLVDEYLSKRSKIKSIENEDERVAYQSY